MRRLCYCGALVALAWCLTPTPEAAQGQSKSAKKGPTWAFQTPTRPAVPVVTNTNWVRNPIDAFIAAKLAGKKLTPAPEADRATLIRRVTFDLTGLPPTPRELDDFVNDKADDAFEKVVDRLLSSPRYGERWAQHWLDLVRFAESDGFKADDPRPLAWRYRDYVIHAFNSDKPYDRFVQEQLAGDELFPGDPQALAATAFNRHFPDEFNARNLEQRRQEILNDITDTTGQVFLGVTLGCARCHDHKYDPISQKDYYRIQAFFAAVSPRDRVPMAKPDEAAEYARQLQTWEAKTGELLKKQEALEDPYRRKAEAPLKSKFAKDLQQAYDTQPAQRSPMQQQLAELLAKQLYVKRDQMTKTMKPEVRQQWQSVEKQVTQFDHLKPKALPETMAVIDVGPMAPPVYLLQRGNWRKKGEEVQPGFLSVIDATTPAIAPPPGVQSTGRRAVLAKWLTRPDHPLTARVLVNRLWQHHFGRGIVGTASDFGVVGEAPTHPELLDWLAREFVERGWSMKAMHRLMVTSAAYRQASQGTPEAMKADPENKLFSRMSRRRLEGEALRDAMLSVSGKLNFRMGGPSVFPELPAEMSVPRGGWPVTADENERQRRSVYVFVKRNLRYPLFAAFDAPDGNETCARRHVSTNAPQALLMLNGTLTLDLAREFAGRLLRESNGAADDVVNRAYRLALGRTPDSREMELAQEFLRQESETVRQRLATKRPVTLPREVPARDDPEFTGAVVGLCHVLLNVNEFAYVD